MAVSDSSSGGLIIRNLVSMRYRLILLTQPRQDLPDGSEMICRVSSGGESGGSESFQDPRQKACFFVWLGLRFFVLVYRPLNLHLSLSSISRFWPILGWS